MTFPSWKFALSGRPSGISAARESGQILVWDANRWLVLLGRHGRLHAQIRTDLNVIAAAIAEDGSAVATVDDGGNLTWRTPDLTVRWRSSMPVRPTALAMDALGRVLAVADATGRIIWYAANGSEIGSPVNCPRPVHHLAFASTAPLLFAAADFGMVTCIDLGASQMAWLDAPVVHMGGVAAAGDPASVAVACFSEGIRRYSLTGAVGPQIRTAEPCRLVASTFNADRYLVGGVFGGIDLINSDGTIQHLDRLDEPPTGLVLSPRGEFGVVAVGNGQIVGLNLRVR